MIIAIDGQLCDELEAVVSVYDHGFLYGVGLFETFRTYEGIPFLLKEHLERLKHGCQHLAIAYQTDVQLISDTVAALLKANQLTDGYFRLSVSGGVDLLGLPQNVYTQPKEIMYVKALPSQDPEFNLKGRPIQMLSLRRNTPEGAVREKSFHYLNNILGKRELANYPWATGAEGIFLNESGYLAEGIVSNLFFIRGQTCYTPALETGILSGITRAYVLKLAKRIRLTVIEGLFFKEELLHADEVFLTNSIQEIVPVSVIYDLTGKLYEPNGGKRGEWTKRLMSLYALRK